jgi:hypothetical protein
MFRQILAAIPSDYKDDVRKISGGIHRGSAEPEALKVARQALDRIKNVAKALEAIRIEYDVGKDSAFDEYTLALDVAVEGVREFLNRPVDDRWKKAEAVIFMRAIYELMGSTSVWASHLVDSSLPLNTANERGAPEG